jgi:hypothetical protein
MTLLPVASKRKNVDKERLKEIKQQRLMVMKRKQLQRDLIAYLQYYDTKYHTTIDHHQQNDTQNDGHEEQVKQKNEDAEDEREGGEEEGEIHEMGEKGTEKSFKVQLSPTESLERVAQKWFVAMDEPLSWTYFKLTPLRQLLPAEKHHNNSQTMTDNQDNSGMVEESHVIHTNNDCAADMMNNRTTDMINTNDDCTTDMINTNDDCTTDMMNISTTDITNSHSVNKETENDHTWIQVSMAGTHFLAHNRSNNKDDVSSFAHTYFTALRHKQNTHQTNSTLPTTTTTTKSGIKRRRYVTDEGPYTGKPATSLLNEYFQKCRIPPPEYQFMAKSNEMGHASMAVFGKEFKSRCAYVKRADAKEDVSDLVVRYLTRRLWRDGRIARDSELTYSEEDFK